jgi:hypothetical protein
MLGGLMMGIGQALLEETVIDHHYGRIVNQDLAEYLVAVHADTPQFEHIFVDEQDGHVSPIGAKGLGDYDRWRCSCDCQCGVSCDRETHSRSTYHVGQVTVTQ